MHTFDFSEEEGKFPFFYETCIGDRCFYYQAFFLRRGRYSYEALDMRPACQNSC